MSLPALRLRSGNPLAILAAARAVARREGWGLRQWDEFRASCAACFEAATLEEQLKMMAVVESHFAVERLPGFTFEPSDWDAREKPFVEE